MVKDFLGGLFFTMLCVILPIVMVFLNNNKKIRQDNVRKDIILAALEKDANVNIEELVRKMNAPQKLLKEKLLRKLLIGSVLLPLGLAFFAVGFFADYAGDPFSFCAPGMIFLAIGIAFIANYFVGKKMLAGYHKDDKTISPAYG